MINGTAARSLLFSFRTGMMDYPVDGPSGLGFAPENMVIDEATKVTQCPRSAQRPAVAR
ncbi:MAG TPA: hypothetical protein VMV04_25065 [Thermodesulfobacteriota bacterium]|nr:hypothetical protein [Thermodesulfobacteriota bacterium]